MAGSRLEKGCGARQFAATPPSRPSGECRQFLNQMIALRLPENPSTAVGRGYFLICRGHLSAATLNFMNQVTAVISRLFPITRRTSILGKATEDRPVRRYAAMSLVFLALPTCLFAAEDDDNSRANISKRLVIGHVTLQLTNLEVHVIGSNLIETLSWEKPGIGVYFGAGSFMRNPGPTK